MDARTNTLLITDIHGGGGEWEVSDSESGLALQSTGGPASASFDVRLFEVDGGMPEGLSPATLAALPGARSLGSALVVLGLEQRASFELGEADPSVQVIVSLQLDGGQPVLVLRAHASDEGRSTGHVARAVALDQPEAFEIRRRERAGRGSSLVLLIVPA